jgi:hypothetical protein
MESNEKVTCVPSFFRLRVLLLLLLFGYGACLTYLILTPGHNWGGDFAHYLHHAHNLCANIPYTKTYFILNPDLFNAPPDYPPGYPLLLSPLYCLFGNENLLPYKILTVTFYLFGILLLLIWLIQTQHFSFTFFLLCILLFNPHIFKEIHNQVISDEFFFFLTILIFLTYHKTESHLGKRAKLLFWFLLSLLICIAILTRTVGFLFLPSLFLSILFHRHHQIKPVPILALCIAIFVTQWLIQHFFFHITTVPYWKQLALINWKQILTNARWYFYLFRTQFGEWGWGDRINLLFGLFLCLSLFFGFLKKLRTNPTFIDYFVSLYTIGVLLLWPIPDGFRFFLPILLWVFLYLVPFTRSIPFFSKNPNRFYIPLTLIMLINFHLQFPEIRKQIEQEDGPYTKEAKQVFQFIRTHLPLSARIAFHKPRVLAFFTKREAIAWKAETDSLPPFLNFLSTHHVTHVLVCKDFSEDRRYLLPLLLQREGINWKRVYQNTRFQLYQVNEMSPVFP